MSVISLINPIVTGDAEALNAQLSTGATGLDISSPGGNLMEALTMFDSISKSDVAVTITGVAASAAHMLSLAGKALPKIVDFGAVLIHRPRFGNDTKGKDNFQKQTLSKLFNSAVVAMSKKTGLDRGIIEGYMNANNGEGTWFSAEELVGAGMASEVIETEEADKGAKMEALKNEVVMQLQLDNQVTIKSNIKMQKVAMHFGLESEANEAAIMQAVEGLEAENVELKASNLTMQAELDHA